MTYIWVRLVLTAGPWEGLKIRSNPLIAFRRFDFGTVPSKIWECTEVRFADFLPGGFTTMAVINPLERKLAKLTCVLVKN